MRWVLLTVAMCLMVAAPTARGGEVVLLPETTVSRIVFGSCLRQDRPAPIWQTIVQARPDLTILLGDNIYGDTEDMAVMAAKYQQLAQIPGFAEVRAMAPMLATWDDHDFGRNDAGAEYPKRADSKRVMMDFFAEPADSPRQGRDGVYASYLLGPAGKRVQVILLDTRWFRSPLKRGRLPGQEREGYIPSDDPGATMLGETQWQWLEAQLRQPADLRVIGSSIQVLADGHRFEKWANLPAERSRLLQLITDTGANGVMILSGDRHRGEVLLTRDNVPYPIADITSSALNQGRAGSVPGEPISAGIERLGTAYSSDHFGLIEIDWATPSPTVTVSLRNVAGEPVDGVGVLKLTLDMLRPTRAQ